MKPWIGWVLECVCDRVGQGLVAGSEEWARAAQRWFRRAERWRQWRRGA